MRSIASNLITLKYLVEKIVDLSHSILFLEDKSLVPILDSLFAELLELEKDTIKLVFKIKEKDEYRLFLLDVVSFMREQAESSLNLANLVKKYDKFPPFFREIMKETHQKIIVYQVHKKSKVKDLTVSEVEHLLPKTKVVAVRRLNSWIAKNIETMALKEGDSLLLKYSKEVESELNRILKEDE